MTTSGARGDEITMFGHKEKLTHCGLQGTKMLEMQTECGRECVIEREEVLMSRTCVNENTVSSWTVLITANEVYLLLLRTHEADRRPQAM